MRSVHHAFMPTGAALAASLRCVTIAALFLILVMEAALSQGSNQYRVALSKYAFQNLKAMPIFHNKRIAVGDLIDIANEQVSRSASRCYPDLNTALGQEQYDYFEIALGNAISVSGGAEVRQAVRADAALKSALMKNSVLFIDRMQRTSPIPDQLTLSRANINDSQECDYVREIERQTSNEHMIVSVLYRAEISGGFLFGADEEQKAEAATRKLTDNVGEAEIAVRRSGNQTEIHLTGSQLGTIAVQGRKLDREALAKLYVLLQESPQTIAELEEIVHTYITTDAPSIEKEIGWFFRGYMEKLGLGDEDIDGLKIQLFAEDPEKPTYAATLDDIPQEHWDAAGVIAAGLIIQ